MKKLFSKFLFTFIFVSLISCKGSNGSNSDDYTPGGVEVGSDGLMPESEPEPSQNIDWKDGNVYSYDYTESIVKTDSLGNDQTITVYKRNKPSENSIVCEPKICKWCSNTSYAVNYTIEEYPNINWLRGQPDLSSVLGMFSSMLDGNKYYDFDNNMVRTEWRTNCEYNGPDGFCSERCKSEYSYR